MGEALRVTASVARRRVDLDVRVPAGEVLALVGRNGAGKSTCVQLAAGALRPDAGEVEIGDRVVADAASMLPAHRRRVGYLEQRPLLFPHLSVLDNVAFGPRARGANRATARARAAEELAAVGLADRADGRPRRLSGGQAQRVAIARALAIDPDVVLLDEPFAALDASSTPELRRLLRDRLRGRTTVLVTHDPLDVLALADRVAHLEEGRVVAEGTVEDVFQRPGTPFLADFVGLNLLHGTAEAGSWIRLGDGSVVAGLGVLPLGHARAVFPPDAVSIFRSAPHGSPRNELAAVVTGVEDRGLVQRVSLEVAGQRLHADVTPSSVRDLELAPGARVIAVIKATQVLLHPAGTSA